MLAHSMTLPRQSMDIRVRNAGATLSRATSLARLWGQARAVSDVARRWWCRHPGRVVINIKGHLTSGSARGHSQTVRRARAVAGSVVARARFGDGGRADASILHWRHVPPDLPQGCCARRRLRGCPQSAGASAGSARLGGVGRAGYIAELCVAEQGGAGSDADRPGRHGPACPLGPACQMRDCSANALLAVNPENARSSVIVPAAGLLSVGLERETLTLRAIGAQSARAPPRA